MSDDGQRVIVVKLVVELVRVGVGVSWLWRFGVAMRCVVLLTGVVCVTALRAAAGRNKGPKPIVNVLSRWPNKPFSFISTSLCPEECDGGCQRCVVCLWNSAFLPPLITKSVDERIALLASLTFACVPALFIPRFCGFLSAASPCCRWSQISWAGGCWGHPSVGSSRIHPSSCSGRL